MPYYIATVWTLSAAAGAVAGDTATYRRVVRKWAEDERAFVAEQRDANMRHVDDDVWFGPVGLSRDQRTPA